ncbi:MAG TPA: PIN domain-containing protein [Candidatus Saccharimonadales bacterium]|jgi:predicted nucleic acid-binding protein|nr:PIN domain-containing protein [Candidatus Saccharimonadales bacterium]
MTSVFDTSALSDLLSDEDYVVKAFTEQEYDSLAIPLATDAELRFGFVNGNRAAYNLKNYELFKQQFNVNVIQLDQDTAIIYADLAAWARQHGLALSNNDFWIAATTIQIGGNLLTSDGDFKGLPQLRIIILSPEQK